MDQQYMGTDKPTITKKDVPVIHTPRALFFIAVWCVMCTVVSCFVGFLIPTPTDVMIAVPLALVFGLVLGPIVVDYAAWVTALKVKVGAADYMSEVNKTGMKESAPRKLRIAMLVCIVVGFLVVPRILMMAMHVAPDLVKPAGGLLGRAIANPHALRSPGFLLQLHAMTVNSFVVDLGLLVIASRVVRWYNELPD